VPAHSSRLDTDPLTVSPEEAARRLSIPRSRIYQLLQAGELRSMKEGRRRLIVTASIADYVNRRAD